MSRLTLIFVIIVVLAAAGVVYFTQYYQAPTIEETGGEYSARIPAGKTEEPAMIRYTESGYIPSDLKIKKSAMVIFKNESAMPMWPASAMHPTHMEYPVKGGCLGSTFDACRELMMGESWAFTFDMPGMWKYHDHKNPTHFGSVTVEE